MFAPPLNNTRDAPLAPRVIAGHVFDPLSDRYSCGKTYSDIAAAPETAIGDDKQAGLWCHLGTLVRYEWEQIQDENQRIFECARS